MLTPGARIGPYEIVSSLGAGGMGEVYRARDTKLNRVVAIKVLPDLFAGDGERLARFTREAQTLASLNHPHIAHVHGLEESGGLRALVMELVEGQDLSQRLARGLMPLDEALALAKQIAEALEAAHDRGIVHRDLKPANIKVRTDGTVKVLDFGLAKLVAAEATDTADAGKNLTQAPTVTTAAMMTRPGVILGTAAYMSPEQARGDPVDKRTDIWAFGCVLYEMLTGRGAFAGRTLPDTLAAVLSREPDWAALPTTTPRGVRRLGSALPGQRFTKPHSRHGRRAARTGRCRHGGDGSSCTCDPNTARDRRGGSCRSHHWRAPRRSGGLGAHTITPSGEHAIHAHAPAARQLCPRTGIGPLARRDAHRVRSDSSGHTASVCS
jgi:serine/threonine protein kinase